MVLYRFSVRIAGVIISCMLLSGALASVATGHTSRYGSGHRTHRPSARVVYASTNGRSGASGRSCTSAKYSTVQSAVDAASKGSTVFVCHGTYTEDVIISKALRLTGRHAVIDGSSTANGNCDQIVLGKPGSAPCLAGITIKSSRVRVDGLTVTGAVGEGILATGSLTGGSIHHVVIDDNRVVGNNTGGIPPTSTSPYPQCAAQGQVPGDCGEGIHLMGVVDGQVSHNYLSGNEGGVLLTDEFGPTHGNVVDHNVITKNAYDCGITAPGHNPRALDSSGHPQPSVAGVYDNVIEHNRITDNGLKGEGAGVLFANALAGTASYDNLVKDNYISGNELSGVTMHAHTVGPGQFEDLSGNRIIGNVIGRNNVGGPGGPGDPLDGTVTDPYTTGVLVFSGTVPVHVTIAHNRISNNRYGIWLGVGGNVTAKLKDNSFHHVTQSVFTNP